MFVLRNFVTFMVLSPCFKKQQTMEKRKTTPEHLSPHPNEAPPPDPEIMAKRPIIQPCPEILQRRLSEGVGWFKTPKDPLANQNHIHKYLPTEILR